nr:hypothetical protein [Tanacetum cinerariifolium]
NTFFCKKDHDDYPDDEVLPEGEKGEKKQKTSRGSKSTKDSSSSKQPVKESRTTSYVQQQQDYDVWYDILEMDEDECISEDASPNFMEKIKSLVDKKVSTINDHQRMEATLKDMMKNQIRTTDVITGLGFRD